MKAIIYARQSSGSDDYSESVEQQLINCRRLAEEEKLTVIGEFTDLNTSGKTYPAGAEHIAELDIAYRRWFAEQTSGKMFRTGLGAALRMLDQTDYLLVDDITRLYRPLTRSFLEQYIDQKLDTFKVRVWAVKGGVVNVSDFGDALVNTLQARINDNQIAIQRRKAMDAFKTMRDSGFLPNGGRMFAAVRQGKRKLAFDKRLTGVVRHIYDSVCAGEPYNRIIRGINSEYAELFRGRFYRSRFFSIARQPLYCGLMYNSAGDLIPCRELISPPPVEETQWREVQRILSEPRAPKYRRGWKKPLFSGMLRCGHCGARLSPGKDHGNRIYFCQNRNLRDDPGCLSRIALYRRRGRGLADAVAPLLLLDLLDECAAAEPAGTALPLQEILDRLPGRSPDSLWSEEEYRRRLPRAVERIIIFSDRVEIITRYGTITLPRDTDSNRRNLPECRIRVLKGTKKIENSKKIRIFYYNRKPMCYSYKILETKYIQIIFPDVDKKNPEFSGHK